MLSLSLDVGDELLCLVGASGSGKSTVLRSIAGVLQPDNGSIEVRDRQVLSTGLGVNLPPAARLVGFVPQSHALFGHLTAAENIAYPLLKHSDVPASLTDQRVELLSELLELGDDIDRPPAELHPLVQLRVALGRALVTDPEVLLLDDPFAHLEREMRTTARQQFADLLRRLRIPTIFATVELEEGYAMGDRIALLDGGRLLQVDQPRTLMLRPASRRVAELVRSVNVFEGTVVGVDDGLATIDTVVGIVRMPLSASVGEKVDVVIRPEHVELAPAGSDATDNGIAGSVTEVDAQGTVSSVAIRPDTARGDATIVAFVSAASLEEMGLSTGSRCLASLPARALHAMPTPPVF